MLTSFRTSLCVSVIVIVISASERSCIILGESSRNFDIFESFGQLGKCYKEFNQTFEPCASQASRNSEPALFTQIMEETSAPSPRMALIVLNVDKS